MKIDFSRLDIQPIRGYTFSAVQFVNAGLDLNKAVESWNAKYAHVAYIRNTGVFSTLEVRTSYSGSVIDQIITFFVKLTIDTNIKSTKVSSEC